MAYYMVWERDGTSGESYWVSASTPEEARRLVASNIQAAGRAADPAKFDCQVDDGKKPPEGMIYRRLHGPVAVVSRAKNESKRK
jgi:hypothetical protein